MRYVTSAWPETRRILLVESGSRSIIEAAIPRLRKVFGADTAFHLITCYAGAPAELNPAATVWRTQHHGSPRGRARLIQEMKNSGITIVAMVCSNEQIMTRWKWWLAWKLPAKVLIVNENADCFWFDTAHLGYLRGFVVSRMGVTGEGTGHALASLAAFPFVLAYLLLYATIVHARRALRMAFARRSSSLR
jgi:hypothetical protein